MNVLFLFLLKAALINALMLGFYHFAIRPGRNFKLMRIVLIFSIILPILQPVLPQPFLHSENSGIPVYIFSLPAVSNEVVITPEQNSNLFPLIQNTVYLSMVAILFLGTLLSILSIFRKCRIARKTLTPYGKVLIDNSSKSPYSFFKWVFFSDESLQHPSAHWLLRHEFSHVKHGHSFDRLLSAIFRAFFWFSPFAYFNHKLLAEVHEYQADADAIEAFGNKTVYNSLIISFTGISGQNYMTNPFSAHLKKRMIMMNNLKPGKLHLVRIATGVIVIAAFTLLASMVIPEQTKKINESGENGTTATTDTSKVKMTITYDSPEEKIDREALSLLSTIPPSFPGGDDVRILFFQQNIKYPSAARNKNIQGKVLYRVIIDKYGKVTEPSIEQGIGGGCDEEVMRVVKMMPDWEPGKVNGEPVKVEMIIPVTFKLSDNKMDMNNDKEFVFHNVLDQKTGNIPEVQNDPSKRAVDENEEVFTVVENSPKFPGGDEARIAYLQKTITYPEKAKKDKIAGTVYISFIVEKNGAISHVKVLRGIGGGCDEVAVSAIQNMPAWTPGTQRDKPVRVQYNMPVKFTLSEKEKATAYLEPATDQNQEVFTVVEIEPVFPGGKEAQQAYLKKAISYPALAKKNRIEGVVYVTFVVETDGSISNVKILRGVGGGLDEVALDAVKNMPAWKPGTQKGLPVRVQYNMPVKFKLGGG